jgi:RNA polymerase sigma-70 factor (ECF subfamily)
MVVRMLQDYEEASEITQEAFLAAWLGLPSFRGEARFATWLYRIAYHCALKQLERRKRERSLRAAIQAEQILEEVNKQKQAEDIWSYAPGRPWYVSIWRNRRPGIALC